MSKVTQWIAAIITFGSLALFVLFLVTEWRSSKWTSVIFEHFPATIGLPMAAAAAFVVVAFFRTVEGPIRLEALSVKFEGASGPILMWVISFGVIAGALKALW